MTFKNFRYTPLVTLSEGVDLPLCCEFWCWVWNLNFLDFIFVTLVWGYPLHKDIYLKYVLVVWETQEERLKTKNPKGFLIPIEDGIQNTSLQMVLEHVGKNHYVGRNVSTRVKTLKVLDIIMKFQLWQGIEFQDMFIWVGKIWTRCMEIALRHRHLDTFPSFLISKQFYKYSSDKNSVVIFSFTCSLIKL